jgi:hypothetical protein
MTSLDQFVAFANALPLNRRGPVEEALDAIMATYADEGGFSAAELSELDRRLAEPKPAYASPEEIANLLGKPFA